MNKKMVERYFGYCFDGKGYIKDRQHDGRKVIVFDFPIYEDELAKKICEKCIEELEKK